MKFLNTGRCLVVEALLMRGGTWRWLQQSFAVGLLEAPDRGLWLVDTGLHPRLWQNGWTRLFLAAAQARPLPWRPPEKPQGIFLTHFHLDHAAGLLDFPDIPVLASRRGFEHVRHLRGFAALRAGWQADLLPADFERRAVWLEDLPERVAAGIRGRDLFGDGSALAAELPGHAPGQHGLVLPAEREFFLADAAGHPFMVTRKADPRLPILLSHDRAAERKTLQWLRSLPPEWKFSTSHHIS